MSQLTQQGNLPYVILDTSYLIAYKAGQFWTLSLFERMRHSRLNVVISRGVMQEYAYGGDAEIGAEQIRGLLGFMDNWSYASSLSQLFEGQMREVVRDTKHGRKTLSETDISIAAKAIQMAREGKDVVLATSDSLLEEQVDSYRTTENLNIEICSPSNVPVKHESIDYLVSGSVFGKLKQDSTARNSFPTYLAIGLNHHIGGRVHYNLAFDVYSNRTEALSNPRFDDVKYVRVVYIPKSEFKTFNDRNIPLFLLLMAFDMYAIQTDSDPYVYLVNVDKPYTLREKRMLLQLHRSGKTKIQ